VDEEGVFVMGPATFVGGLIVIVVWLVSTSAADPPEERKPATPKFAIYASEEDADFRSTLFKVLHGNDKESRFDLADKIEKVVSSEAEVLILVLPRRELLTVKKETLKALKTRKIIGIGYGAATLFGKLGLEINGGAHFGEVPPAVTIVKSQLLGEAKNSEPLSVLQKVDVTVPNADKVDNFAMFLPTWGENSTVVDAIARWTSDANYAPIVRQGNCVLIGIPVPATRCTAAYTDLFREICRALYARELERFSTARRELTKPGTYEFKLAQGRSTDQPSSRTFFFRFTEACRFKAHLEHAGSDSVMLIFMGEDEGRTHWNRQDARRGESLQIRAEISQQDIEKLRDRYWKLKVTNFRVNQTVKCKLAITIEKP
jgi:hypothetical protein